jgi:hypothetical protein
VPLVLPDVPLVELPEALPPDAPGIGLTAPPDPPPEVVADPPPEPPPEVVAELPPEEPPALPLLLVWATAATLSDRTAAATDAKRVVLIINLPGLDARPDVSPGSTRSWKECSGLSRLAGQRISSCPRYNTHRPMAALRVIEGRAESRVLFCRKGAARNEIA